MRFTRACHKFKKVSRFFKFAKKEKKNEVDQRLIRRSENYFFS